MITITEPNECRNIHIERQLLTSTPNYKVWEKITKKHYSNLLLNHPLLDNRAYQYQTAALYCSRRFNVCSLSMGLGKTIISALTILSIYGSLEKNRGGAIHIVVPSILSGKSRWLVDFNLFPELQNKIAFIEHPLDLSKDEVINKPIWIYTHDFPKRHMEEKTVLDLMLKRFQPNFLLIDEVHNLKKSSQRTKGLIKLRKKAKRVLALSGTISDGRLDLIQTVLNFVYNKHWDYFKQNFASLFSTKKSIQTNYIFGEERVENYQMKYLDKISLSMMSQWYEISSRFIHRLSFSSPNVKSCISIPNVKVHDCEVIPNKDQISLYRTTVYETKQVLENILLTNSHNVAFRARAFSLMQPLLNVSNSPPLDSWSKLEKLKEICTTTYNLSEKTLILCNSVKAAYLIKEHLVNTYGSDKVVRLYGSDEKENPKCQSNTFREQVTEDFQYNETIKFAVMSINLVAESIDLTSAANIIFYDYTWQSLKIFQSKARVVRSGNKNQLVNIYFLRNKNMIDTHQYNLLHLKEEISKQLIDFEFEGNNNVIQASNIIEEILAGF